MNLSPFSAILKVLSGMTNQSDSRRIRSLVESIIVENGVVLDSKPSREAFFASLQSEESWVPGLAVFTFLDNCILRVTQKPVHYLDWLHELRIKGRSMGTVSLLFAVIAEQWPFVVKSHKKEDEENIALWIARYLGCSKLAEEDEVILSLIRDDMLDVTLNKKSRSTLKKTFKQSQISNLSSKDRQEPKDSVSPILEEPEPQISQPSLQEVFGMV